MGRDAGQTDCGPVTYCWLTIDVLDQAQPLAWYMVKHEDDTGLGEQPPQDVHHGRRAARDVPPRHY